MSIEFLYWARSICGVITFLSGVGMLVVAGVLILAYQERKPEPIKRSLVAVFTGLMLVFILTPPSEFFNASIDQAKQERQNATKIIGGW